MRSKEDLTGQFLGRFFVVVDPFRLYGDACCVFFEVWMEKHPPFLSLKSLCPSILKYVLCIC